MNKASIEKKVNEMETIATLAAAFLLLYFIFHKAIFVLIAFTLLVMCLLFKKIASRISILWLGFSRVLGNFNSKIILTLIFFLFITPIAFFYRLFSKNSLLLKKDDSLDSYFYSVDHNYRKNDFEKQW